MDTSILYNCIKYHEPVIKPLALKLYTIIIEPMVVFNTD